MKKFLSFTGVFLIITLIIGFLFAQLNTKLFNHHSAKFPEDTKVLACGASLARNAINDSLIPGLVNVSIAGRTYLELFLCDKRIIKDNPQIKTIITTFSLQALPRGRDYFFFLKNRATRSFNNIYPLLDYEHLSDYPINHKLYYKSLLRQYYTPNINYLKNSLHGVFPEYFDYKIPYIGKYTIRDENNLDSTILEDGIKKYFYYKGESQGLSEIDISYLDSIVQFTKKENINLVLFSPPMHHSAIEKSPLEFKEEYRNIINHYRNYPHIKILEYYDFPIPDSCFANHNHLNYKGAKIMSNELRDTLSALGLN